MKLGLFFLVVKNLDRRLGDFIFNGGFFDVGSRGFVLGDVDFSLGSCFVIFVWVNLVMGKVVLRMFYLFSLR